MQQRHFVKITLILEATMFLPNEPFLIISVECGEAYSVCGSTQDVVMIPFTGTCDGPYFSGKTLGIGVDTQRIPKGGNAFLSARYMLEGTDFTGQNCRIFIENQGIDLSDCKPTIITDSKALSELETASLRADVEPKEGGVVVRIFREL